MDSDRRDQDHPHTTLRARRFEAVLSGPENAAAAERVLAALGLDVEQDDPRRISPPFPEGADALAERLAALR